MECCGVGDNKLTELTNIEMDTEVRIVDGAFDETFIQWSAEYFTKRYNWKYGNRSGAVNDEAIFWISVDNEMGMNIEDDPLVTYIQLVAQREFEYHLNEVDDIYLNGHTYELDGTLHSDVPTGKGVGKDLYTLLYMPNFINTDVIGNFEFMRNPVEYVPGRLVMFPSIHTHRGLAPKNKSDLRITLAWKCMNITWK